MAKKQNKKVVLTTEQPKVSITPKKVIVPEGGFNKAPKFVVSTKRQTIKNDTKIKQLFYDAYQETHILNPGESKMIDVLVTETNK